MTAVVDSPTLPSLIAAIDQANSPEQLMGAVQSLVATQDQAAIPVLIKVLGYNNPGAAVLAVEGLVQMGDRAVLPLLESLDDYNYGARAYGIRALAAIADPRALEVLLSSAETDFAPSVRRAATKGLGQLKWEQLPPDQIQPAQNRALQSLTTIALDGDWSLRYAAIVGLEAIAAAANEYCETVLAILQKIAAQETDRAVIARAQWAIAQLTSA